MWCDRPGTHLCDLIIGRDREKAIEADPGECLNDWQRKKRKAYGHKWPEGRPPGTMLDDLADMMFTCDAPMCDAHRQVVGNLCGERFHDTFDMCFFHWGWDGQDVRRLITTNEAEAYRRRMRMAVENRLKSAEHEDFYG